MSKISGPHIFWGYVAQLVPPPARFTQVENWAAHKILGMPLSLDANAMFDLQNFGGVKLPRVACYMKACMLRAAAKTVTGYTEMVHELEQWAPLGVPVAKHMGASV